MLAFQPGGETGVLLSTSTAFVETYSLNEHLTSLQAVRGMRLSSIPASLIIRPSIALPSCPWRLPGGLGVFDAFGLWVADLLVDAVFACSGVEPPSPLHFGQDDRIAVLRPHPGTTFNLSTMLLTTTLAVTACADHLRRRRLEHPGEDLDVRCRGHLQICLLGTQGQSCVFADGWPDAALPPGVLLSESHSLPIVGIRLSRCWSSGLVFQPEELVLDAVNAADCVAGWRVNLGIDVGGAMIDSLMLFRWRTLSSSVVWRSRNSPSSDRVNTCCFRSTVNTRADSRLRLHRCHLTGIPR